VAGCAAAVLVLVFALAVPLVAAVTTVGRGAAEELAAFDPEPLRHASGLPCPDG